MSDSFISKSDSITTYSATRLYRVFVFDPFLCRKSLDIIGRIDKFEFETCLEQKVFDTQLIADTDTCSDTADDTCTVDIVYQPRISGIQPSAKVMPRLSRLGQNLFVSSLILCP